ncbi:hypothetical protein J6590_089113 [Homalodisca vitripennis]|nr:hypothetical protein J6590_089113 [Homalodisca vitripennis]
MDGCQIIKGDINIAEAFATYFKSTFIPSSLTGKFTDPGTCLSSLALVIDKIFEGDETCMNMKREAETTTVLGDTERWFMNTYPRRHVSVSSTDCTIP